MSQFTEWRALRLYLLVSAPIAALIVGSHTTAHSMAMLNMFVALFCAGQFMLTNGLPIGHGARPHIAGMPVVMFALYMFVLFILMFLGIDAHRGIPAETIVRIRIFALSGFLGWLAALTDWYWIMSTRTFYTTEARTRRLLKHRGLDDRSIDRTVEQERAQGLYGPRLKK